MPLDQHAALVREVEQSLHSIYLSWQEKERVDPFAISWPSETIYDDKGYAINNIVLMELDMPKDEWKKELGQLIVRTKANALLLVEERDDAVLAVLETRSGSRSWRYPIVRHGIDRVLDDPVIRDDKDAVLLYQPN